MKKTSLLIGASIDSAVLTANNDVLIMDELLSAYDYNNILISGKHIQKENIKSIIKTSAIELEPGDSFVFYFSGHGRSIRDVAPFDEKDQRDEVIILNTNNEYFIDDELWQLWKLFHPKVNLILIVDACHSGTIHKSISQNFDYHFYDENDSLNCNMILISATADFLQYKSSKGSSSTFTYFIYSLWKKGILQNLNYIELYTLLISSNIILNRGKLISYNAKKLIHNKVFQFKSNEPT